MDIDQTVDHPTFAIPHRGHVHLEIVLGDSELLASSKIRSDLGAVNDILAWEAGDVRTGTSDIFSLDNGYLLSLLGQRPRHVLGSFAAAQNDKVVVLRS